MERVGNALTEKLSALSVGKDFNPETDMLVQDSGSKRRKGGMHLEADFGGEQDCGIDSKGAMSGVESSCGEVEQELTADSHTPSCSSSMLQEEQAALCTEVADGPPDGFLSILPYTDLKSLLTLERVSKHMRSGVNDVLVWRKLEVEPPLSRALTDDILMTLVKRAGGLLKVMRLVRCSRITDGGLANALSLCPQLEKLEIPGCTGLNIDALVHTVEQHCAMSRSQGMCGIKQLRIRGMYEIHQQSLYALRDLILSGPGHQSTPGPTQPVYMFSNTFDDHRAIDVEMCPRCDFEYATIVFDCTRKSCQNAAKIDPSKACRGCFMCLPRCSGCGNCLLEDEEFERTCCVWSLCFSCWAQSPRCAECNTAICWQHKTEFLEGITQDPKSEVCVRCRMFWKELRANGSIGFSF
ncbi:hypothetical protein MPTK1_5g21030 [Marchantia polymorpha subsp. ruderalis]|uniref:F-box domain-containing protein n=1 Tax=Marchantia polymorpha subsp. ruderalis TaxID=1480154 RepID=A0AAF6BKL6_MARPO|nr:hypothetical protein Mp_5g21030 [Marchantia polymorpha subsp. ruderalis]